MTDVTHSFADGEALAAALAERVAKALSAAIADRGVASLAVSGGSTPKRFFQALSGRKLDWSKVIVTLVDERNVQPGHERSNQSLVEAALLQGPASAARLMGLYHPAANAAEAARIATASLTVLDFPFDVVILGMGNDGHTASFFPGGDQLAQALDPATPVSVLAIEAPGAGEPRLTFSYSALDDARLLVLHIEGQSKADTLALARTKPDEADMPIRSFLNRARSALEIYWAP